MGIGDQEKQRLERDKSRNDSISAGEMKYKQLLVLLRPLVVTNFTDTLKAAGRN